MAGSEFTLCPRPGASHLQTSWEAWEGGSSKQRTGRQGGKALKPSLSPPGEAVLVWLEGRGG